MAMATAAVVQPFTSITGRRRQCSALLRAPQPPPRAAPPTQFTPVGKPKLRYSGTGGRITQLPADGRGRQAAPPRRRWCACCCRHSRAELTARPPPAAALGLHDGLNVQKPALMADTLERQLPAPPIRCAGLAAWPLGSRRAARTGGTAGPCWCRCCHAAAASPLRCSCSCPASRLTPPPRVPPSPLPARRAASRTRRSSRLGWSLCGVQRAWTLGS